MLKTARTGIQPPKNPRCHNKTVFRGFLPNGASTVKSFRFKIKKDIYVSLHAPSSSHLGTFDADMRLSSPTSNDVPDTRIDRFTFFSVLLIVVGVTLPLILFPEQGADWVAQAKGFITDKFGVFYLMLGVMAVLFVIYISFSDIGNIKLGKPEDEMEFSTSSWAAMMFCGGIGASILYWASSSGLIIIRGLPLDSSLAQPRPFAGPRPTACFTGVPWPGPFT